MTSAQKALECKQGMQILEVPAKPGWHAGRGLASQLLRDHPGNVTASILHVFVVCMCWKSILFSVCVFVGVDIVMSVLPFLKFTTSHQLSKTYTHSKSDHSFDLIPVSLI